MEHFTVYDLLNEFGMRIDGRRPLEFRQFRTKLGVFVEPHGSAYLEQGCTKVLVAVYGPNRNSEKKATSSVDLDVEINCIVSIASFCKAIRKVYSAGDCETNEIARYVQQAMMAVIINKKYLNYTFDVVIEVLQIDGGHIATAVNCAMLAFIDAGVDMREYVTACSAAVTPSGEIIRDIAHVEITAGAAPVTVALLSSSNRVLFAEMSQRFHVENFERVLEEALDGCREILAMIDVQVRKHVENVMAITDAEAEPDM
ncbi:exosome complex component RRP41 [Teleopsis dalmanni]|uniref:exosome complex component RRP41 n=1 Tax=Teleopsis dalmanni TaxID=139649 RepID=UPI0018CDB6A8|nr:exosome complex component RRP41 [Teleopsis dalmanni]